MGSFMAAGSRERPCSVSPRSCSTGGLLLDEFEAPEVEGPPRRRLDLDQALAHALGLELLGAVVAVRHVAAPPQQGVAGPGAAAAADLLVVATPAIAPQLVQIAVAGEAQRRGLGPDLGQRTVAQV